MDKWHAWVQYGGKEEHLGFFTTEDEAKARYDARCAAASDAAPPLPTAWEWRAMAAPAELAGGRLQGRTAGAATGAGGGAGTIRSIKHTVPHDTITVDAVCLSMTLRGWGRRSCRSFGSGSRQPARVSPPRGASAWLAARAGAKTDMTAPPNIRPEEEIQKRYPDYVYKTIEQW
jgi:hypothetical protein